MEAHLEAHLEHLEHHFDATAKLPRRLKPLVSQTVRQKVLNRNFRLKTVETQWKRFEFNSLVIVNRIFYWIQ